MGEENYDYWNMTSAMALPHAISYNSIFNSPSSTGSSGGNTASKSSEKTYTLNSSKSNWNFDSDIPKTVVKNSEGNYTLGKNNEWNFDTKYNILYTEPGNKGQGLVSVPSYDVITNSYIKNLNIQNKISNTIRVGRWMSRNELEKMLKTGRVQSSEGGITHVTNPSDPEAFKAAKKGSVFVEFDIDKDIIKPGGKENWGIIHGSGSPVDRFNIKKGLEGIKEMPKVYNIEIKGEK